MEIFELGEMAKVLGMSLTTAKNWTIGRPLELKASVRTATGQGSRNLYSLEDVYLMGVANELSHAGMAAAAIKKFVAALQAKFPTGLAGVDTLYTVRGEKLSYRIETRQDRIPANTVVRLVIDVAGLRERIEQRVRRGRR
jgi:hypothetical protein